MILCDIGNTTYHFLIKQQDFKISVKDSLKSLVFYEQIYFISVNKKATKKFLKQFPNAIDLEPYITLSTKYNQTLGIDRQVVSLYAKNKIIVDIGSAITVDIIQNNIHQGGFILPGFDILKKIYPNISKKLQFNFSSKVNLDKIPTNTDMAINYAIFQMIILPIKDIKKRYDLKLIFTGENSKYVMPYFQRATLKKYLIFDNMKKLIKQKGIR